MHVSRLLGSNGYFAPVLIFDLVVLIFGGCCSNVLILEEITRSKPHSASLLTLSQHLLVTLITVYSQLELLPSRKAKKLSVFHRLGLKKPKVPFYHWAFMVILFFFSSQLNNMALGFQISMPLHIIFRSGTVVVSMLLGLALLRKVYSVEEVTGVLLVSAGVIISTLASSGYSSKHGDSYDELNNSTVPTVLGVPSFVFGITFLLVSMFISAGLGIYQQFTYQRYGKQWQEGLFYIHTLGLPLFLLFASDIKAQVLEIRDSPRQWGLLLANAITQYFCISGVHRLSAVTSALTLNVMLTVRKFLSLALSVYLFGNVWTVNHTVGACSVLLGTFLFFIGATNAQKKAQLTKRKRA